MTVVDSPGVDSLPTRLSKRSQLQSVANRTMWYQYRPGQGSTYQCLMGKTVRETGYEASKARQPVVGNALHTGVLDN